ncbi:hypothetical protein MGN70_001532 [Eutypa lata]|uniref:Putative rna drb0094 family protein n=1 Tax=Eutypa lata (strain UCR-EL1) TaxID=1287681 RepID=M7TBD7_EUTLA|nr:putative rna drb0094 family protein [Eutypa lata UCREL1]KAI1256408.1 hypothetical protein MGN70_001532 [Eutypa lata]
MSHTYQDYLWFTGGPHQHQTLSYTEFPSAETFKQREQVRNKSGYKLVTIGRISSLRPIKGHHALLAEVKGWTCAVKPGEYKVEDAVVFFEIDAFLPASDKRFAHFKNLTDWRGKKGYHVKPNMVGKWISQGLIMPLSKFPEITGILEIVERQMPKDKAFEDLMRTPFDMLLGVERLLLNSEKTERSLGRPPMFIPKTDLECIQNCSKAFHGDNKNNIYQESTKMDGCSMTVYFVQKGSQWYKSLYVLPKGARAERKKGRVGVCSRTHDLPEHHSGPFWPIAWDNGIPKKLAKLKKNIALQGELCGSGISESREGFDKDQHQFYVFRIFDIDTQEALLPWETERMTKGLGLQHVPVSGYFRLRDIADGPTDLLKRAEGLGINGNPREGLVYRNVADGKAFKVICNCNL